MLIVFLGPLALALMHCTVTLAQTEELSLEDGLEGLRLHWKRGLALGAMTAAVLGLGAFAIAFYAGRGPFVFPLAVVVFYLLAFFALFQMWLWPLAVLERERPFGEVMRDAARGAGRAPPRLGRARPRTVRSSTLWRRPRRSCRS